MQKKDRGIILFSGGGTLGPVTPLLALHERMKEWLAETTFIWIGTKTGPERALVEEAGIACLHLPAGKFRRYLSPWNLIDMFRLFVAWFQSIILLVHFRPKVCVSAGGFVSVPVHLAAWILRIPTWIHQQDVRVGLANRIMAPFATIVTTALESSPVLFPKKKSHWIGNPVRRSLLKGSYEKGRALFHLSSNLPVVFVTGGGTGSQRVNELVLEALETIRGFTEVIHVTGPERSDAFAKQAEANGEHYQHYRFLTHELKDAYAVADLVISRGGFGTLTELAALKKAAIIIPKPGHQEENVLWLEEAGAVVSFDERIGTGLNLAGRIQELLADKERRKKMGECLHSLLPLAKDAEIREIVEGVFGTPGERSGQK